MKNKRKNRFTSKISDLAAGILVFLSLILLISCSDDNGQDDPEELSLELTGQDVSVFRGNDGSAKAVVKGGMPPYSYEWSNGETGPEIDGLAAGLYSVTVTDDVDSVATGSIRIKQPVPENIVTDREGNIYLTVKIGD